MQQKEFETRVKMQVTTEEYAAIEVVYMNSDLDKDEFCKAWAKMNRKRIAAHRAAVKAHKAFKAMPIEQQAAAKLMELAEARSNESGSKLPVSDARYDAETIRSLFAKDETFEFFVVLRNTGCDIKRSLYAAKEHAREFGDSNPTIYRFVCNRSLNHGRVMAV